MQNDSSQAAVRRFTRNIWLLFWLSVPGMLAVPMTNENTVSQLPQLKQVGQILSLISIFGYGIVLMLMRRNHERYWIAGLFTLASGAASLLVGLLYPNTDAPTWTLLISLPATVLNVAAEYMEYTAHFVLVEDVDPQLAAKWKRLWYFYIGILCIIVLSLVLLAILPVAGVLLIMATPLASVAIEVLKLAYLYRTARSFD